jgi:uncharacterized protein YegL
MEVAYISVLTFDSDARQVVPLTEISNFAPPVIGASGGTSMGAALKLVTECAEREVVKNTPQAKGDWKPLVFIMTDGSPTDDVRRELPAFRSYKWGTVVACAAGPGADTNILRDIAKENILYLDVSDGKAITAFFKWVSSSIAVSSKKADSGTQEAGSIGELPPPPPEITLMKF